MRHARQRSFAAHGAGKHATIFRRDGIGQVVGIECSTGLRNVAHHRTDRIERRAALRQKGVSGHFDHFPHLGIGQQLPAGFDAYNLPMQYRDDYQDGDDAIYRYADGNIYQADPKTQIIEQIISAIA